MTDAKLEWIIDSDSHLTETRDVWTSRVPKKWVEHVPHVARNAEGQDAWFLEGEQFYTVGVTAVAGWPTFPDDRPKTYEDCLPAAYNAHERLKYMDEAGIWAQVLYPNIGGFGGQTFLNIGDDELKLACVRAYNDYISEEWSEVGGGRLLPVMSLPFWDIEATVAEIQRCAGLGLRGILFTGEPQRFGLPYLGDRHWEPLWSVAEETGLPMHFHVGGAENEFWPKWQHRAKSTSPAATSAYSGLDLFFKNATQCGDLITSGVLQRHPNVKFVSVESGIGWVPFLLEAADYMYDDADSSGRGAWSEVERSNDKREMPPSELFTRQVLTTYWFENLEDTSVLDRVPIGNVMFETDFPHPSCLYGNIRETIEAGLGKATEEVRRKVLWQNAAELYGIEMPVAANA